MLTTNILIICGILSLLGVGCVFAAMNNKKPHSDYFYFLSLICFGVAFVMSFACRTPII